MANQKNNCIVKLKLKLYESHISKKDGKKKVSKYNNLKCRLV